MFALFVLRQYIKSHVLIVRLKDSKYAQSPGRDQARSARTHATYQHPEHSHCPPDVTYPAPAEHIRVVRADLRALLARVPYGRRCDPLRLRTRGQRRPHSRSRLPGGTFTVRVKISHCDYVRIEVEDNGGPSTHGYMTPPGITGSILSALSLPTGASTAITPPAPSGQDSTGQLLVIERLARFARIAPRPGEDFLHYQSRARGARRPGVSAGLSLWEGPPGARRAAPAGHADQGDSHVPPLGAGTAVFLALQVVLGTPGSGKSLFLRYLAWSSCSHADEPDSDLPVIVPLTRMATKDASIVSEIAATFNDNGFPR